MTHTSDTTTGRSGVLHRLLALLGTAALLMAGLSSAHALPPDGPGPETPGTSSRVWPTEVAPGDTLYFEVSGYPANEIVYIKIDDGLACSDTSHGACVYHTQALDANGYATGSIVVPDLAPGAHWLRMLATGDVFDPVTGERLGYEGYTRRGGNDFTVVVPSGGSGGTNQGGTGGSGGSGGSGGTGGSGDAGGTGQGDAGGQAGGTDTTGGGAGAGTDDGPIEGGSVGLDLSGTDADDAPDEPGAAADGAAEADDAAAGSDEQDGQAAPQQEAAADDAQALAAGDDGGLPVLGLAVLGGAVVIGAGGVTWALLHRRRATAAAASGSSAE